MKAKGFSCAASKTVRDKWQNLNFKIFDILMVWEQELLWNQQLYLDYGISREDKPFYIGIGQAFKNLKINIYV
jgi:hypothetical protein